MADGNIVFAWTDRTGDDPAVLATSLDEGGKAEVPKRIVEARGGAALLGLTHGAAGTALMFEAPVFEISARLRDGPAQALSEFVATFGLIGTIAGAIRYRAAWTPALVGLYISAAYWFTASTSFANPAVTIARALSNSFAGIAPHSVPWFLLAQLTGAATAFATFEWLFRAERKNERPAPRADETAPLGLSTSHG